VEEKPVEENPIPSIPSEPSPPSETPAEEPKPTEETPPVVETPPSSEEQPKNPEPENPPQSPQPPESPQQPEVKEVIKEVIMEAESRTEPTTGGSGTGMPIVNQEEVQRQVAERLKVEQGERRKLANEARVERKKDNLNKILAFARERKTVTNDDVRDYLHISQSTATNYLTELVNRGMLKRESERGGTKYTA